MVKVEQTGANDMKTSTFTVDVDKAKALMPNLGAIQSATNTSIKVTHKNDGSQIQIRGQEKDNVETARKKVQSFVDGCASDWLQASANALTKLYKREGPGAEVARKFQEIRNTSGLTILKKGDGLSIIGPAENVKRMKTTLQDLLQKAAFEP